MPDLTHEHPRDRARRPCEGVAAASLTATCAPPAPIPAPSPPTAERVAPPTVDVRTIDTAATALWLLGLALPSNWTGRPGTAAFDTTGAPVAPAH